MRHDPAQLKMDAINKKVEMKHMFWGKAVHLDEFNSNPDRIPAQAPFQCLQCQSQTWNGNADVKQQDFVGLSVPKSGCRYQHAS